MARGFRWSKLSSTGTKVHLCFAYLLFTLGSRTVIGAPYCAVSVAEDRLDEIFDSEEKLRDARLHLSIRFLPSFHAASQVEVVQLSDTRAFAVLSEANRMVRTPIIGLDSKEDLAQHVEPIKVTRHQIELQGSAVQKIIEELFAAMVRSLPFVRASAVATVQREPHNGVVVLDGTKYWFRYWEGHTCIEMSYTDDEVSASPTGTSDLAQWANALRLHLKRSAAQEMKPQ